MKYLTTNSIRSLLNISVADLDDKTADKLRLARNHALVSHREMQKAPVLAWLNHHGVPIGNSTSDGHKILTWVAALLLVVLVFSSFAYLQNTKQHEYEHSDIDIDLEILIDDLPVDAYIE